MVDVFLPFRNSPVVPAIDVRSTLIMAGIQSLREHGLFQRYSESLSSDARERIAGLAAGIWVPVEVAVAHYSAMDRIGIEPHTIEALGAEVAARAWKHILSPVVARAKRIGPKPWEAFVYTHETLTSIGAAATSRSSRRAPRRPCTSGLDSLAQPSPISSHRSAASCGP